MKKISVESLKEGMIFSKPVFIEGNNMLAPAGAALRKKDIDRLHAWEIESVETEGELLVIRPSAEKAAKAKTPQAENPPPETPQAKDPPAQNLPEAAVTPAPKQPGKASASHSSAVSLAKANENEKAYRTYLELIEQMDEVCRNITSETAVEARSIDNIAARLLQSVREQRNFFISYILGGEVKKQEMAKNLVNTAILSALIAIELKMPHHKILQVVTGALLHDVGMLRMPKDIVEKRGSLSAAELQRIQAHTLYTYKIVNKELLYSEDVGLIALQHHERWDGEGYPRRLAGTAIDLGARIVSVADAFEAMVTQKPYRNSMMGYQAMKNLLSDNLRRFDPDVIKAFIQTMGIYPIGSIILLNSGAMARVIDVQPTAPLRPTIKILVDEFGKVFKQDDGETINLLIEKSLFIARAVDPKEIAGKDAY